MIRFCHTQILLIIAAVTLTLASCRSSQQSNVSNLPTTEIHNAADAQKQLQAIVGSYGDWDRLRMPVTIRLNGEQRTSISGTAIMERDKSVFISLRFLGFEVANVYATTDSIFVVDKYNKQYAAEDIHQFLGGTQINISNVQSLLLGHMFVMGETQINLKEFDKSNFDYIKGSSWAVFPDEQNEVAEYGFVFHNINILEMTAIKSSKCEPVVIKYSEPTYTAIGPVSESVNVTHDFGKNKLDADIVWDIKKATWNEKVELRQPSINSKYRRLTSDQIATMLKKLQ